MRDKRHAQHAGGFFANFVQRFDDFDAAALAATAGVDLCFDHPYRAAKLFGRLDRFIGCESHMAARHGHPIGPKYLLGLIFVNVHGNPSQN